MVRTRTDDEWSEWTAVDYHDEHGPDPDSEEAKNARPGTDPLLVGEVEAVQAKAVRRGRLVALRHEARPPGPGFRPGHRDSTARTGTQTPQPPRAHPHPP